MTVPELHRDRARAESFGAVAEAYDLHRPDFPDALLDDLAALGATDVLDVGCGTGKVARGLARRGLAVLGVEIDPRMAAVARGHGVRVEVARFETWEDGGRRFDLVTCGDAWHWIDRAQGPDKVAGVLKPGGAFAWFWNAQMLDEPVMQSLAAVYREHAPEVYAYGQRPPVEAADPLPLAGPFSPAGAKTYLWERRATAAEWATFAGTISDHQRLPCERLASLQAAIRAAIERLGDAIVVRGATVAYYFRRD